MLVTDAGIVTAVRLLHLRNARLPMVVIDAEIVTTVRLLHK